MKLLNIGFGNMISYNKLVSIIGSDSAPIKRAIQEAKKKGNLIDATYGRKTKSVVIMDSGHVVLSALQPETIANRFEKEENDLKEEGNSKENE